MNPDALSDLVLALACIAIVVKTYALRPALAMAAGLLGVAATFGVARFSGVEEILPFHKFASYLAACVSFPLVAAALRWPLVAVLRNRLKAAGFAMALGVLSLTASAVGLTLWSTLVPAASATLILVTVIQRRNAIQITGAVLVTASFIAAALNVPGTPYLGVFTTIMALHYLLATGLLMLTWEFVSKKHPAG